MKTVSLQSDVGTVFALLSKSVFNSCFCFFLKQLEILIE